MFILLHCAVVHKCNQLFFLPNVVMVGFFLMWGATNPTSFARPIVVKFIQQLRETGSQVSASTIIVLFSAGLILYIRFIKYIYHNLITKLFKNNIFNCFCIISNQDRQRKQHIEASFKKIILERYRSSGIENLHLKRVGN